jgi:peptide/nickel transport system permease protein
MVLFFRRLLRKSAFLLGGGIVLALVLIAIAGPYLAPHDAFEMEHVNRLKPPSATNLFGTDEFGRDVLSRMLHGTRVSLKIGAISVGIALGLGGGMGLLSGYFGGWLDMAIMGVMDLLMAFPTILVALAIVAVLGPSLNNAMMAVGLSAVPAFTRLVRGSVLVVREQVYIEAARAVGGSHLHIMIHHILRNIAAPVLVLVTLQFPAALLSSAALGFIGLGAQPPSPEWGAMMVSARQFLRRAPWMVNYPGFAIMLTVLGFNLLGNALRDVLDPTQRHRELR